MNGSKNITLKTVLLLSFITAFSIFIYFIISGRGVFTVRDDFNAQQIPFTAALHDAIREGGLAGFNWTVDLGGSNVLSYGFYELGSVFFWLSLLVPTDYLPYAMAPLYILKYMAAACFAFLYISHFVKNRSYALAGALLYAFSGFQAVNLMFYHFHEAVAFFPLLLLGLERMMGEGPHQSAAPTAGIGGEDPHQSAAPTASPRGGSLEQGKPSPASGGRWRVAPDEGALVPDEDPFVPDEGPFAPPEALFAFAVFLNCITNYFFFIQEVIFLIIYFLFRFFDKDLRLTAGRILRCLVWGLIGVGMASVIFFPSVLYILGGDRASEFVGLSALWHDTKSFLSMLGGCLLPAQPMHDNSFVMHENWKSMSCYIPLLGAAPALIYVSKKRDWLQRMLIVCAAFSLSPLLSSVFTMMTEYYVRWWYMQVLMMALAAALLLGEVSGSVTDKDMQSVVSKKTMIAGFGAYALVIATFYLFIRFVPWDSKDSAEIVFNSQRLLIYTVIALLGAVISAVLTKMKNERLWLLSIAAFCALTTFITLYFYRSGSVPSDEYMSEYRIARQLAKQSDELPDQYRIDLNNSNVFSMAAHLPSMASFISTRSPGVSEFEELFGYYSTNNGIDKGDVRGLTQLLAGRYVPSFDERDDKLLMKGEDGGKTLYIYDSENACPIGFPVTQYITESDFLNIDVSDRAIALLQAAVVKDDGLLDGPMRRVTPGELNLQAEADYFVQRYGEECVRDFKRSPKGFSCSSDFDEERYVYFTVPFDEGWECLVDGTKAQVIDSGGMILTFVPAGTHSLEFRYHTPNLKAGFIISLISWILFLALFLGAKRKAVRRDG